MRATLAFFGQIASHWRETGAIAPSGPMLAKAMAKAVGTIAPGQVIIELGPGSGVFTRELVKRFPANPILAVEFNPVFVRNLKREMPHVTFIEGCASQLSRHLETAKVNTSEVGAVISGLPLLMFPPALVTDILHSIAEVLPAGRPYVQFTYSKKRWQRFNPRGFQAHPCKRVWLNMPPAVVLPFTRAG
jgi:phosphatidylethanolamine/phosphatidyl-N-methylethanolamine N-methyltransferase